MSKSNQLFMDSETEQEMIDHNEFDYQLENWSDQIDKRLDRIERDIEIFFGEMNDHF